VYAPALTGAQAALSVDGFARAWASGEALSLEQATDLALAAVANLVDAELPDPAASAKWAQTPLGPEERGTDRAGASAGRCSGIDEARYEEARHLWAEARPLAEELGATYVLAPMYLGLALLARAAGEQAQTADDWARALAAAQDLGSTVWMAASVAGLADWLVARGEAASAAELLGAIAGVWPQVE
jgi:hypothetical protein